MAPRRLVRRGHWWDDFGAAVVCLMDGQHLGA